MAEVIMEVFQRGHRKGGLQTVSGQSEAAVPGIDWSEVLGWYTGPQEEDHRGTTSQMQEVRQLRHDTTRHDTTTTPLRHLICAYGEKPL